MLLVGVGAAQSVCQDDLRSVQEAHADAPPAALAAALLRRGVETIEPAYPVTQPRGGAAVDEDAPGAEDAQWLARRGFLADGWQRELTPARWQALLEHWLGRYDAGPLSPRGTLTPDDLVADTSAALTEVADAVRPLALLATETDDEGALAFTGVIWNWTPRPRFLLQRPEGRVDGDDGVEEALRRLGNCAVRPRHYLLADAETAASLYLGSEQSRMRLLATEPPGELPERPLDVPNDEAFTYLSFEASAMEGVRLAAVGFEGPGPGVLDTLDLLGKTESNVNPFRFQRFFKFPP